MANKSNIVKGPLTDEEELYIKENYLSKSVEDIAGFLKRSERQVKTYVNKLPEKTEVSENTEIIDASKEIASRTGIEEQKGAFVMTETGAENIKRTSLNQVNEVHVFQPMGKNVKSF